MVTFSSQLYGKMRYNGVEIDFIDDMIRSQLLGLKLAKRGLNEMDRDLKDNKCERIQANFGFSTHLFGWVGLIEILTFVVRIASNSNNKLLKISIRMRYTSTTTSLS